MDVRDTIEFFKNEGLTTVPAQEVIDRVTTILKGKLAELQTGGEVTTLTNEQIATAALITLGGFIGTADDESDLADHTFNALAAVITGEAFPLEQMGRLNFVIERTISSHRMLINLMEHIRGNQPPPNPTVPLT